MENQNKILDQIKELLKKKFLNESTGHDWWHILRVYNNANYLSSQITEPHDKFLVQLGALLHDIADWKFHEGSEDEGPKQAALILEKLEVESDLIKKVQQIIKEISFKGAHVKTKMSSLEGEIVQDADRLDALGAVGIARTFAYGGKSGKPLHDPDLKPVLHVDFESYKKKQTTPINHFYEKLLLLKDRMNTIEAKKIAEERHEYMEIFLEQFFSEWEGTR
jgi:uncharacterized protein